MRSLAILLLAAAALCADPISDLRSALEELDGESRIVATLDLEVSGAEGDKDDPLRLNGTASATVSDGPEGVTIRFAPDGLERAQAEAASSEEIGRDYGARLAVDTIDGVMVHEHLNAAPVILRHLRRAELVAAKDDALDGRPARLLELKITPRPNVAARKYIKEVNISLRLWLDRDGLPAAAHLSQVQKGRALLVIGFEAGQQDEFRYSRIGDRLVAIHHSRVTTGSGAGQHSNSKTAVSLLLHEARGTVADGP